jgi:hypothetical protein
MNKHKKMHGNNSNHLSLEYWITICMSTLKLLESSALTPVNFQDPSMR